MPGTLKRLSIATAIAAAVGVATLPSAASAGPAEDLVGGVQKTVDDTVKSVNGLLGQAGGGAQPAPQPAPAPTPLADGGTTEPGIDGTNPHGQGEALDVTTDLVLLDEVIGTVIVGQSRGEQDEAGNYHGSVTVLDISGLDLHVGVETDEGETETSPLDPINTMVLDSICDGSGGQICLGLLEFESTTDENGSQNSFSTVNADVGDGLVTAGVLESEGNISDDGSCQTANGSSTTTDVGAADILTADTLSSESESTACNDGTESASGASEVANLDALGIDLDLLVIETLLFGCDGSMSPPSDTDQEFSILLPVVGGALEPLLSGVCHGDDTNGAQADSPYNVRKALGVDVLSALEDLLGQALTLDVSTSESLARAPCPDPTDASDPDCPEIPCPDPSDASDPDCPEIPCPDPTDASDPDCPPIDDCPNPNNENDPDCPDITIQSGGPGGPSADDPDDELPFTGADIGTLSAIGLGVMALGLALMAASDRRRRTVA